MYIRSYLLTIASQLTNCIFFLRVFDLPAKLFFIYIFFVSEWVLISILLYWNTFLSSTEVWTSLQIKYSLKLMMIWKIDEQKLLTSCFFFQKRWLSNIYLIWKYETLLQRLYSFHIFWCAYITENVLVVSFFHQRKLIR